MSPFFIDCVKTVESSNSCKRDRKENQNKTDQLINTNKSTETKSSFDKRFVYCYTTLHSSGHLVSAFNDRTMTYSYNSKTPCYIG